MFGIKLQNAQNMTVLFFQAITNLQNHYIFDSLSVIIAMNDNNFAKRRSLRSRSFAAQSTQNVANINAETNRNRGSPPKSPSTILQNDQNQRFTNQRVTRSWTLTVQPQILVRKNVSSSTSSPSLKRGFQSFLPSSQFPKAFENHQPHPKRPKGIKIPIIKFNSKNVTSTIPQLIPNEPQHVEDEDSENENDYVTNSVSELWPTFDDDDYSSNCDQSILQEKNLSPTLFKESLNEDYQNATQTTFNSTTDTTPSIKAAEKESIVMSDSNHFKPLTISSNKSINEKLKIPFDEKQNGPFSRMKIGLITASSAPDDIYEISSEKDSFFKCLSIYFCGEEKYFETIKDAIRQYFFENFTTLGIYEDIDFSQMQIFSPEFLSFHQCQYLCPAHFNYICKWLNIRICIFKNSVFEKYGNWNDTESPTLLLNYNNGLYSPVLTLL